jgi:DNA-binding PadR family transcriptional regulator
MLNGGATIEIAAAGSSSEEAGLVVIEKRFVRKKPNTNTALTETGRARIAQHWDQLDQLRRLSKHSQ